MSTTAATASTTLSTVVTSKAQQEAARLELLAQEFENHALIVGEESPEYISMLNISGLIRRSANKLIANNSMAKRSGIEESPFAPIENLHDGNVCADDEEEFPTHSRTCYKQCALLTGGAYIIRTSPFSCCARRPCSLFNSKTHLGMCSGFDIAGDAEGSRCPNGVGACLNDEELFNGLCYKKCSLFVDSGKKYFHRVGPETCCSTKGLACLLPYNLLTDLKFSEGGGAGDGFVDTPRVAHPPLEALTEALP